MSERIREIQQALVRLGYAPGPVDGIKGPRTIAAIKQFQRDANLYPDGIVGRLTSSKLFVAPAVVERPPWMEEAYRLVGIREKASKDSNPEILRWGSFLGLDYHSDDVPWCGLFVAHCIASQLQGEQIPTNPLAAQAWLKYGKEVEPIPGSILVFWRISPKNWRGHVGFCVGQEGSYFLCLGGNQGDKVSVAQIHQNRLLGARWPSVAEQYLDHAGVALTERLVDDVDEVEVSENEQ